MMGTMTSRQRQSYVMLLLMAFRDGPDWPDKQM